MAKILIVEDEGVVAMDISWTLSQLGHETLGIASSCEEAVKRSAERTPDLVLMDIGIKGERDGIETAEILRDRFDPPIVYLTAFGDEATVARAKKTGPYAHLVKPLSTSALRCAIDLALHHHQLKRQLRERERWFSTILASLADAVVCVDNSGKVTFMNAVAESLAGASSEQTMGRPLDQVLRLSIGLSEFPLAAALREQQTLHVSEVGMKDMATGCERTISLSAAPVVDSEQLLGSVMVFRDVSDQVRAREFLRQQALRDDLTRLYNRRGFHVLMEQALVEATSTHNPVHLLCVDQDGLKRINDSFGHVEGDRALIDIADLLRATFRKSDVLARLGGDEFAVLLAADDPRVASDRLLQRIVEFNETRRRPYRIAVSLGLATWDPDRPESIENLIRRADAAMYRMKRGDQEVSA